MKIRSITFSCLFVLFSFSAAWAQVQAVVTKVNVPAALEKQPLAMSVDLSRNTDVSKVRLWYRSFGESEFKDVEMLLTGRTASVTLPADIVVPPYIEYYIEVTLQQGTETYPLENPRATPLQAQIKQADPKDQELRMLSPEPGETVPAEDFTIAVSLYFASDAVDRTKTRITLDGVDVSKDCILTEDVVLYNPKNFGRALNMGAHFLKVELRDTAGNVYHSRDFNFGLSTTAAIAEEKARFQAVGNGQLEFRNENLSSGSKTYLRGDFRTDATYSILNFGASAHVDNQEKPELQPQNRFLLYGETSFLRIQAGDAFPRFPSYIVSGKRVRGLSGSLMLGFLNVDASWGKTERLIEGLPATKDTLFPDSSAVAGRPSNSLHTGNSTTDIGFRTYNIFTPGTFDRSFLAVRPSFGNGDNYQLGFTYMKSKDDFGSVKYGTNPGENLVIGTDLLLAADDQKIKLETQASLSLVNTDISTGNFTDAEKDSLVATTGVSKAQLNLAEKLITVNENLFPTNPIDKLSGLAGEAAFSLNYFNNYLRAVAFHRGAAYKSFGNEFLQTDLQGILASDYIRLFSSRVLASVAFEQKQDNTASTKEVTTKYLNINGSITINPGVNIPTFQLGYGQFGRKAGLDQRTRDAIVSRPDSVFITSSADELTSRYLFASNYDFQAGMRHTASLSFSLADRKDNTYKKQNQQNMFIQTALTSYFSGMPLQTTLGILYSKNKNELQLFRTNNQDSVLSAAEFNYTILTAAGQYRMLDDQLRLIALVSPAFGAISRVNVQVGADYVYKERHNFILQVDYIKNSGFADDMIASLIYRFNF